MPVRIQSFHYLAAFRTGAVRYRTVFKGDVASPSLNIIQKIRTRKPVARRQVIAASHDLPTGVARRPHADRVENAFIILGGHLV